MPILMNRDKKNAVSVILGKMSGGTESGGTGYGPPEPKDTAKEDKSAAKRAAVDSLFSALERKDSSAGVSALETFIDLCSGEDYGDGE